MAACRAPRQEARARRPVHKGEFALEIDIARALGAGDHQRKALAKRVRRARECRQHVAKVLRRLDRADRQDVGPVHETEAAQGLRPVARRCYHPGARYQPSALPEPEIADTPDPSVRISTVQGETRLILSATICRTQSLT